MARESNAPKVPSTPQQLANGPYQSSVSRHPEFGKPSPLRSTLPRSSHPFNIPKSNISRPEHHRAPISSRPNPPQKLYRNNAASQFTPSMAVISAPKPPSQPNATSNRLEPVKMPTSNNLQDDDGVKISRPENVLWSTPQAERVLYVSNISKPPAMKISNASKNLQAFVDLTRESLESGLGTRKSDPKFGEFDPYTFMDAERANENIKALLEGAFEDEADEQHVRPTKRPKKRRELDRKTDAAHKQIAATPVDADFPGLDELASQLQDITVGDTTDKKQDNIKGTLPVLTGSTEMNESRTAKSYSKNGTENEDDGEEKVGEDTDEEDEDDGTVEGLKVKLLPHQVAGVDWMCDKETGRNRTKGVLPKGGILADDMGLGKTVQAIALILRNKLPATDKQGGSEQESDDAVERHRGKAKLPPNVSKSTLVVAPLALIKQWESEITAKVEESHKLRACVYHGPTRAKSNTELQNYDVVITTYGTLTSEHAISESDKKRKGGIFSVYWYRIILDEAHTIKNRNAKATQSAYALDAVYRWCLTGTPLQNNLDELQSLIKFLRIKPYNDLAAWRDQISRPLSNGRGGLAIKRLQVYLKAFMKRRTKDVLKLDDNMQLRSTEEGDKRTASNGFQITKREVIKIDAEFMPGETNLYKRLEQRTENSLEKMMSDKLDYASALVLLLRLRQACNHPELVKGDLALDKDLLLQSGLSEGQSESTKQDDLDNVVDLFGTLSVVSKKCDVCQADLTTAQAKAGNSRCSECEADLKASLVEAGKARRKDKQKKNALEKSKSRAEISSVGNLQAPGVRRKGNGVIIDGDDEVEDEQLAYGSSHEVPDIGQTADTGGENVEGQRHWLGSDDSETDDEQIELPRRKGRNISPACSVDESESESDTSVSDEKSDLRLFPSTKIQQLMQILKREAFDYKFIVFSIFTSMLDKVEPFLRRAGIGYARYDGSMRNDHREASLNKLRNSPATRVLLCSLRAGALGLNLTAASRVVIMEPFWNPFVEEQAIDRVHRLNQTLDVKIYKLIVKDTVEERIIDLQERKRELANVTIEGKSAGGKLTMGDMMALFGRDAELRYAAMHGEVNLPRSTRVLGASNQVVSAKTSISHSNGSASSHGGARRVSPPSVLAGTSHDQSRLEKSTRPPARSEDSIYGRRW